MDTLTVEYLNGVVAQMTSYGERVQFSLTSGQTPNYQVINTFDKKMAFNGNHHLMHPQEDEFTGSNATTVLTLEQVKAWIAGVGVKKTVSARTARVSSHSRTGSSPAAAKVGDLIDVQKYEYFKNNVQKLPEGIRAYSQEVSNLMKNGMSAEAAFGEIVQQYF
ncbi:hypothetical protein [Herminiimonas fonticola]|uniref:hypothetical protein n=1 Tax=Herminiimonas fonticola TaxID=303380 RepID=UPI000DFFB951|nr:hypothetical protein [Herminiimonas fonticola]RBA24139.1 hypothetical protein Hfont_1951 [Herminiimonas fonticola]